MGRCLTFNFTVDELLNKMRRVRYFVYLPDFESAGPSSEQYFFASVRLGPTSAQKLVTDLEAKLQGSRLVHREDANELRLWIFSKEAMGAITETQIEDLIRADSLLDESGCEAVAVPWTQDVLFGESFAFAKEYSLPRDKSASFAVPPISQWCSGRTAQEARLQYELRNKK